MVRFAFVSHQLGILSLVVVYATVCNERRSVRCADDGARRLNREARAPDKPADARVAAELVRLVVLHALVLASAISPGEAAVGDPSPMWTARIPGRGGPLLLDLEEFLRATRWPSRVRNPRHRATTIDTLLL